MVNTLSGSVCAYRKETVKPRFIRIDEVMALLDVTQDEAKNLSYRMKQNWQLLTIRKSTTSITISGSWKKAVPRPDTSGTLTQSAL